jgi:hypothetical protein
VLLNNKGNPKVKLSAEARMTDEDVQDIFLENVVHLSMDKRQKLLKLLQKFESLIDGKLGD